MIELKHPFGKMCYDIDELFTDGRGKPITRFNTFMSSAKRQSEKFPTLFDPNTYYGSAFEAFVEAFILSNRTDRRVYCCDYQPVLVGDMGVDGYGYGYDGEVHVVQCKARSDTTAVLDINENALGNFVGHGSVAYGAKYFSIYTSANSVTHRWYKMQTGQLPNKQLDVKFHHFGNKELSYLTEDNILWQDFREALEVRSTKNA